MKGLKAICQKNISHKKARIAVHVSDKVEIKTKLLRRAEDNAHKGNKLSGRYNGEHIFGRCINIYTHICQIYQILVHHIT
jgi:hypothetical protein